MVDREIFFARLGALEGYLSDLRGLAERDRPTLLADRGLRAQLERWVHLASESAIDLSNHVIATQGWRTPATYREAFEVLAEHGVIDPELATRLAGWAGVRNIVVHMYLKVDHDLLLDAVEEDLDDLEALAAALIRQVERG